MTTPEGAAPAPAPHPARAEPGWAATAPPPCPRPPGRGSARAGFMRWARRGSTAPARYRRS
ncbi:MAG: hypothetical protein D6686_17520 [Alphaproteobacteria bacterium]|nr:MAG: hypothetical protein D6686_17520 [Alphaproteobacteria bacterium]